MDYKTYNSDIAQRVNSFDRVFKPWTKWENVKLSDICPCKTCAVSKELHTRRYEVQISGDLQEEITEPCKHCLDVVIWRSECTQKLAWYEDHDERLK